ncbi:hypothetical protein PtA15_18A96 [Puccinia triticina]|uniref:protein-tyrosine-phosphatase n=1 Tax=Puccinia triticina TaxID=208348 RepID=A0ABY7D718_9BASI|nr:uncharacterized protein PtA15_18A96 [Puccinia triticina]WAQ93040.1 hypothetical protein PtA15_18A96 [Puccinia triticina]
MEFDGRENLEELDDRSETDSSPVPWIAVKQVLAPTNLKAKRCAAPLDLGYLQPPSLNSVTALQSPSSRFIFTFGATIQSPVGIAFSEKERAGKILPCHKVSSDGLMRISPETMDKLLDGVYNNKISKKMIFDCRFGYEYDGGHICEAINLHDKEAAETMLLQGTLFNGGQKDVPIPSESGKPDPNGEMKKVVLVFHCEYSAMRAPTVAKHLREQDRHKNMTHYPALHYPEIYMILEGGFAKYFSHSPQHCDGSYVRMDDPTHRTDRQKDLNLFCTRENSVFARTKSYTYGDSKITDSRDPALTLNPIHHRPAPADYPAPHYHTHTPQMPIQDVKISNALLLAMNGALERTNFKQHTKIRTLKAWLPAGPLCLGQDPLFAHLIHALVHNASNALDPLTPRLHPPASSTKTQPAQATHKTPPPARTKFLNPLEIE